MKVTFLEASNGLRLSKHYTTDTIKPYPHVKEVTSHTYDLLPDQKGLLHLEKLIRQHSDSGHSMLKGNLKKPLVNESRAGRTDRAALTNLLVLDVDGITLPRKIMRAKLSNADVQQLAEQIITELPEELHDVSYVAQASASLGKKGDRVSIHIFMLLDVALPVKSIKLWLQHVNFTSELFKSQLELSANGQSLKFPLDVSVADNSKIIFIAPPTFVDPNDNPFDDDKERIVRVDRTKNTFDLAALMGQVNPEIIHQQGQTIKDKLRVQQGMGKKQIKTQTMNVDNKNEEVLLNPDKMSISVADTTSLPYVRCNINGGDSNAYYFNIERPTYMYNFKDEPIFEIEKADPDFYRSIFDLFEEELEKTGKTQVPVVLRDYFSDMYYNGVYDPNLNQFTDEYPLVPTSKNSIESFMLSHGRAAPEFIPDALIKFDPTSDDVSVNLKKVPYTVNMFRRTKYMLNASTPNTLLKYGTAHQLKDICPNIYNLIFHVVGNGEEEFEGFINWLAKIYQTRVKTGTSWVLGGVPGTGKGVFYEHVLRPLFGEEQTPMRALENIEEQFNLYMRQALFLVVDEFHMSSASHGILKIADKLKHQITEKSLTIRAMRSNQIQMPSYTNFLFFSNRPDAIKIEDGDRRYNVAPRQEQKLLVAHPDLVRNLSVLSTELQDFANVLQTFHCNDVAITTPLQNTAKQQMRTVSMSVFEEFCNAIKTGDLAFFIDVLDITSVNVMQGNEITSVQRFIKSWIATHTDDYSVIPAEHLRMVYHVQTEQQPRLSQREFTKRLSKNGISIERKRVFNAGRDASPMRGIVIDWKLNNEDYEHAIENYFTDKDLALVAS